MFRQELFKTNVNQDPVFGCTQFARARVNVTWWRLKIKPGLCLKASFEYNLKTKGKEEAADLWQPPFNYPQELLSDPAPSLLAPST